MKKLGFVVTLALVSTLFSGMSPAVAAKSQKISFPSPKAMIVGQTPQQLLAKSSSRLRITYSVTTTQVCKVSGTRIQALMSGQCVVTANQRGNSNFARARSITRVFMIGASTATQTQSISFSQPTAIKVGAVGQNLNVSSTSSLPVSLVSNSPTICRVTGSVLFGISPGSCIISATQQGNNNFLPAPIVQRVLEIIAVNAVSTNATTQSGLKCTILGTEGNDSLVGTEGDDVICGFGGDDQLTGLGGNDVLDGGFGDDELSGGSGNDVLDGNAGSDEANYSGPNAVSVNLNNDSASGQGNDTLPGVENVTGSDSADTITGDSSSNNISGGEGGDTISGGGSNDILTGEGGADTVRGGEGDDLIGGGSGNDSLTGDSGTDSVNGGEGTNTCFIDTTEFRDETCQLLPLLSHLFARVSGKFNNWNPSFTGCYLVYADFFSGGTIRAMIPIRADGTYQFDTLPVTDKWYRIMSKSAANSGGYSAADPTCPFAAGAYAESTIVLGSIVRGATNYIEATLPDFVSITAATKNDLGTAIPNTQVWCRPGTSGTYPFEDLAKVPGGTGFGLGLFAITAGCGSTNVPARTDGSGNFTFLAVKGEKMTMNARINLGGASIDTELYFTADSSKTIDLVYR